MRFLLSILAICAFSLSATAAGKGGWSMGLGAGIVNSEQTDMESVMKDTTNPSGASSMDNAWEFVGTIGYRFSGMTGIYLRPSYYTNTEEGSSGYEYSVSGFTIFPILRFYLLENKAIKFYSQLGLGFGVINTEIKEAGLAIEASGNNIGYMGGLGAEFCFGDHCAFVEGNIRALAAQRMTVDKSTDAATFTTNNPTVSQASKSKELEIGGRDFSASFSGVQGLIGYSMYF